MVMEVEIVSKELIKPTSPTPHHLKTHLLSFLDQFIPPIYIPMVLFYVNQETSILSADIIAENSKRARLLKESLAETLTLFYPLAGRIKDHLSIDCNDEGAYYVEARVNLPLCELLKLTNSSYVARLVPAEFSLATPSAGGYVAMIQATTFACGGVVIGVRLSHMIADGAACVAFLRSWAAMTRKSAEEAACPNFDASSVFPQNVAFPREATNSALITPFLRKGKCRAMRVVFDASAIASLKTKTTSSSVSDPTRVEVVSALLSKCITAAFRSKSDIQKSTLISHLVNLRQRAVPPFPKHSMGNFICTAMVMTKETKVDNLVCHLRKAIRKADGDFVTSLQGDGGCLKFCEYVKETGKVSCGEAGEICFINFSSWCNFGAYEIDYGWGKPTWFTSTASTEPETVFANTVLLMDTKMGNGIEALVYFDEQHMAILEQNEELLAFATLDQSPLLDYSA